MSTSKPWHEDDSFWETWGEMMFSPRIMAAAPQQIADLVALIRTPPKTHVLDLCCGIGRHSLELARRGFRVTGVDRTQSYLTKAKEKAQKEGLEVEFIQEDMRTFCRPETFDAAINLSTSFGYSEDPRDDARVLENMYRSLKQGGVFVLDTAGKEVIARVFQARDWQEANGIYLLVDRNVAQNWSWMENRWTLFKDGRRYERTITHRLFSASELLSLFRNAGFARADAYGGLDGSPYDNAARRLVVVGHKE